MQPDRPSSTAELVCAWRAFEHFLPPDQRILDDPYARGFVGPGRAAVLEVAERLPRRALLALLRRVDRVIQGAMSFVVARHRAIDELLRTEAPRVRQVVLLGAGYDTRAARLADALGGVTLFEVDHPATARRKAALAPSAFADARRAPTVLVSVDFQRDDLGERLRAEGFEPGAPTVWVWEGVSMYLTEDAVRATLALIRDLSAAGATLVFDVWCPPDHGLQRLALRELPALAMRLVYAEPFEWGPSLERLGGFLDEQGFELREATPGRALVERYATGRWGRLVFACPMALCVARVR